MSFEDFIPSSVSLRPTMNIGCLMSIPVGRYHKGKHGEHILNGGLQPATGVAGRGNTFKSTLAHFFTGRALDRYSRATANIYDSEPPSVSQERIYRLYDDMSNISGIDLVNERRLLLTDSTVLLGDVWFDLIKKTGESRIAKENLKNNTGETPFIDREGKYVKTLYPMVAECDSLSMMPVSSVEAIYDKNSIGASGMNVEALRASGAKSQMLMQVPTLTGTTGIHMIFTAHIGDDLALDPYAPPAKKLTFFKNKVKLKQVPEKFTFLMNNLWHVISAQVLLNDTTKTTQYPRSSEDNLKGDTDLQIITVQNMRAKAGPTGMPFELIVSQSEGIKVGLSEFNYIKGFDRYGLGGNDRTYFLELYPDVNLSRTTIRGKIDDDLMLQRALEITSEMCQMKNLWHDLEPGLLITPAELYERLKAKGYDWEILLGQTRGYWVFNDDPNPLHFLSTMDLLHAAKATDAYIPYWYNDVAKAQGKAPIVPKES